MIELNQMREATSTRLISWLTDTLVDTFVATKSIHRHFDVFGAFYYFLGFFFLIWGSFVD